MRTFRRDAHPLAVIAVWALFEAAGIAVTARVAGDPHYAESGGSSVGTAVVVTSILVLFVALGSRVGWWIAIFSSTVGLAMPIVALLEGLHVKPLLLAPIAAASLWIIWSGAIESYVNGNSRPRTAQLH
jgi:hypothetical protein